MMLNVFLWCEKCSYDVIRKCSYDVRSVLMN